jgi:hypothetical protein
MSIGGDHPIPILLVVYVVAVPDWPSNRIASRDGAGVLLRLGRWLGEDARLDVGSGGLEPLLVLVLAEFAEAETKVVDDAFMFLPPLGEVESHLLNVEEALILADLGVDDPLLYHGVHVPKVSVHGRVHLDEAPL